MITCNNEHRIEEIKLLWEQGLGNRKIAKKLDIPRTTLRYLCKKYKLENHKCESKSLNLSSRLISQLTGMILGDGYLSNKYKSSYINFAHCTNQKEYFYHKTDILKELGSSQCKLISKVDKRSNKIYHKYSFVSHSFLELKALRDTFYPEGVKILPMEHIRKYFNDESLAYMYMDDGNYTKYSTTIATCCFKQDNIEEFVAFLKDKFDLEFSIQRTKSIRLKQKDMKKFFSIITPFVKPVKCMKYKILEYE